MSQHIVQRLGVQPIQTGKHFPFALARQVRAGRWRSQEEPQVLGWERLRHAVAIVAEPVTTSRYEAHCARVGLTNACKLAHFRREPKKVARAGTFFSDLGKSRVSFV